MDASRIGAMSRLDKRGGLDWNRQGFFSQSVCSFDELSRNKQHGGNPGRSGGGRQGGGGGGGLNQQHALLLQGLIKDTELQFQQYVGHQPEPRRSQVDNQRHRSPQRRYPNTQQMAFPEDEVGEVMLDTRQKRTSRTKSRGRNHSRSQTMPEEVVFQPREVSVDRDYQDHLSKSYNISSDGNARPRTGIRRANPAQYSTSHNLADAFIQNPDLNILDGVPGNAQPSPSEKLIQKQREKNTIDQARMLSNPGNARPTKPNKLLESKSMVEWAQKETRRENTSSPQKGNRDQRAKRLRSKSQADWELDQEVDRRLHEETHANRANTRSGAGTEIIYINNRPFQVIARDPNSKENVSGKHLHLTGEGHQSARMRATTRRNPFQSYSMESMTSDAGFESKAQQHGKTRTRTPHPSTRQDGANPRGLHNREHMTDPLTLPNNPSLGDGSSNTRQGPRNEPSRQTVPNHSTTNHNTYSHAKQTTNNGNPTFSSHSVGSRETPGTRGARHSQREQTRVVEQQGGSLNGREYHHRAAGVKQQTNQQELLLLQQQQQRRRGVAAASANDSSYSDGTQIDSSHDHHPLHSTTINKTDAEHHLSSNSSSDKHPSTSVSTPPIPAPRRSLHNRQFAVDHPSSFEHSETRLDNQATNFERSSNGGQIYEHSDNNSRNTFTTTVNLGGLDNDDGRRENNSESENEMLIQGQSDFITTCRDYVVDPDEEFEVTTMTKDMYNPATVTTQDISSPYQADTSSQYIGNSKPPLPSYHPQTNNETNGRIDDGLGNQRRMRPKSSKLRGRHPSEDSFASALQEAQSYNNDELALDLGDLADDDDDRRSNSRPKSSYKGRSRSLSESKNTNPNPPNSPDNGYSTQQQRHKPPEPILKRRGKIPVGLKQHQTGDDSDSDVDGEIEILDLDVIETFSDGEAGSPRFEEINGVNHQHQGAWKQNPGNGKKKGVNRHVGQLAHQDDTEDSADSRPLTPRLTEREMCDMRVEKMHSIKKAQRKPTSMDRHSISEDKPSERMNGDLYTASPNHSGSQESHGTPSPIGPEILYHHFGGKVVDKYRKRAKSDVIPVHKLREKAMNNKVKTKSGSNSQHKANKMDTQAAEQTARKLKPLMRKSTSVDRINNPPRKGAMSSASETDSGTGSSRDPAEPITPYSHNTQQLKSSSKSRMLPNLGYPTTKSSVHRENPLTKVTRAASSTRSKSRAHQSNPVKVPPSTLSLNLSDVESPPPPEDPASDLQHEGMKLEMEIAKLRGLALNKTPRSPNYNRNETDIDKFFSSSGDSRQFSRQPSQQDLHKQYVTESHRTSLARSRANLMGSQEDLNDPLLENQLAGTSKSYTSGGHRSNTNAGGKKKRPLIHSKSVPSNVSTHTRKKSLSTMM